MSIEVHVPIEIEDYKESVILGLSIRQILWSGVAFLCGIPTFLAFNMLSSDLAVYATMVVVIIPFCMGWVKKDGYTFEQIIKIKLKAMLIRQKRSFETNPDLNEVPVEIEKYRQALKLINDEENNDGGEENKNVLQKHTRKQKNKKRKADTQPKREAFRVEITKKDSERKRKAALKSIKEERRRYKQKEPKNQKKKKG